MAAAQSVAVATALVTLADVAAVAAVVAMADVAIKIFVVAVVACLPLFHLLRS